MAETVAPATVFLVEDDAAMRDATALLLSLRGYATAMFACAEDFLQALAPSWRGCVITDIRMAGMSGLELQRALQDRGSELPVIVITAHGSIAAARDAFKSGAVDFLVKPFDDEQLMQAIERAFLRLAARREERPAAQALERLSERERQVLALVLEGVGNLGIGTRLGISPRTVEIHKSRILGKTGARNLADLIRLWHECGGPGMG